MVFLCSGLEPGQDGVGDYTRRLAGQLIRQQHTAAVVALNDGAMRDADDAILEIEGLRVPALRLSRTLPWSVRSERAAQWIHSQRPDWISVQFVCFGFHPKGLPFGLPGRFERIIGQTPAHWMFHELWVGRGKQQAWKFRTWGALQRLIVLNAHRRVAPRATHTSTDAYAVSLHQCGVHAEILPIFSNIPVARVTGIMARELETLGIAQADRGGWVLVGIFGTVQPGPYTNDWIDDLADRAAAVGRRVAVLGIGRLDPLGREKFGALGQGCRGKPLIHHFGARSAEHISEFLQTVDGGIATTEQAALGKSGTVAAMREHDLPMLVVRGESHETEAQARLRLRAAMDDFLGHLHRARRPQGDRLLREVAGQLAGRLQALGNRGGAQPAGDEKNAAAAKSSRG